MAKDARQYNKQHVLLWFALVIVALALLIVTVFAITGGQQVETQAQLTTHTFTEDFSSTTFQDASNSTARWDTSNGEASLFQGAWTNFTNRALIGPEPLANPGLKLFEPNETGRGFYAMFNDEPYVVFTTFDTTLPVTGVNKFVYFSRYDSVDERWEQMDGTPGRTQISNASVQIVAQGASITVDSQGNPIVAWSVRPTLPDVVQIFVSRWTPAQNAWTQLDETTLGEQQVTTGVTQTFSPEVRVDSNDDIHLAWVNVAPALYTKWDKGSNTFRKADGTAGFDTAFTSATISGFLFLRIDNNDVPVINIDDGLVNPRSIAVTFDSNSNTWGGFNGVGSFTDVSGCPIATFCNPNYFEIDPAANDYHFIWTHATSGEQHTYWDGSGFRKQDGTAGRETIFPPPVFSGSIDPLAFDPTQTTGPSIFRAFSSSAFGFWDGSSWTAHEGQPFPEPVNVGASAITIGETAMFFDSLGREVIFAKDEVNAGAQMHMTSWTPVRVDPTRNRIQSLPVDNVDESIVSAKLTLLGETRGYQGTNVPQPDVPLNSAGRNQFGDSDCQISNDNGLNFYQVTPGDDFFDFPVLGSRLVYRCDLSSGTLLDNVFVDQIGLEYTTANGAPNLILNKSVDTDNDGVFADGGQALAPGDEITYRITASNSGNSEAQDVIVQDTVPAGTQYVPNSTTVNGASVPDIAGESPLATGLDVGVVPGGMFRQLDWSGGAGQVDFVDTTRFDSHNFIDFTNSEFISQPTDPLLVDANFALPLSDLKLNGAPSGPAQPTAQNSVMLSNGNLYTVWADLGGDIYGRLFDRQGNALTAPTLISDPGPVVPNQRPAAVQLSGGDIVVVWNKSWFVAASTPPFTTHIMMKKVDINGIVLTAADTPLATETASLFLPLAFVDLDSPFVAAPASKTPLVADGSNNFYVGYARSDASTAAGCASSKFRGFDSTLAPLFGEVTLDVPFPAAGSCAASGGPSLALNTVGEIAAVYKRGPFFGGGGDVDVRFVDTSGALLTAAPANLYASGGTFGAEVGGVTKLPGSPTDFAFVHKETAGSCTGLCLQSFDNTGATITAPVSFGGVPTLNAGGLVSDDAGGHLFTSWSTLGTGSLAQLFDTGLNPQSNPVLFSSFVANRSPQLDIDPAAKRIWAVWAAAAEIRGALLGYEPQVHTLTSSVYDAGNVTEYKDLSVTEVKPAGTDIIYRLRTGNTPIPDGSWTGFTSVQPGVPFSLSGQYAQYQVELDNSGDPTTSSELHDLTFSQSGPVIVEHKVTVNSSGGVIANTASATASNVIGSSESNTEQNPVLPPDTERTGGEDRVETAIILSQQQYPDPLSAKAVCVVRQDDPVDALPGSPFCTQVEAPILLTSPNSLDPRTLTEIQRVLDPSNKIYLLGREKAIGPEVRQALTAAGFTNQEQIGGIERRHTSALIAQRLNDFEPLSITRAAVANAYTAADALTMSAPATVKKPGSTRFPVLLTNEKEITAEVQSYLDSHPEISTFYVAGGTSAINQTIQSALSNLVQKPSVERLGGANRFATTVIVADRFFPRPAQIYAMSGIEFPLRTPSGIPIDALLAGPSAAKNSSPLIFVVRDLPLPDEIINYLTDHKGQIGLIHVIGGPAAVSHGVEIEMLNLIK